MIKIVGYWKIRCLVYRIPLRLVPVLKPNTWTASQRWLSRVHRLLRYLIFDHDQGASSWQECHHYRRCWVGSRHLTIVYFIRFLSYSLAAVHLLTGYLGLRLQTVFCHAGSLDIQSPLSNDISYNHCLVSCNLYCGTSHRPHSLSTITLTNPFPSSGIGLETTILFAREGASVLMADISEPALAAALAKVHETVPDRSQRIETFKCDVSSEASVASAVAHLDDWGGVDVMFNNAGIMHADDADAVGLPGERETSDLHQSSPPP